MKRLLITGTREGWDPDALEAALRAHWEDMSQDGESVVLVHGDARGVDTQARVLWAAHGLPDEPHPADWATHGKAAGMIRNDLMVKLGADRCVAFVTPTSRGTRDCLNRAIEADIECYVYTPEDIE